ncbi:MAG TPA: FAD-binding oxidoreductase [Acidobacteriota bacterium]
MGKPVKLELQLEQVRDEAREVKSFRFVAPGAALPRHWPGQFIRITVPVASEGQAQTSRSFTIASAPTEPGYYQLTVKRNPRGVVSNFLHRSLAPGQRIQARAPLGDFVFRDGSAERIALIGAGSGITPLRAILRTIADRELAVAARLLYYNREAHDVIFHRELLRLAEAGAVQVHLALTRPPSDWPGLTGRIEAAHLERLLSDFAPQRVYLCGPPPMMERTQELLRDRGIGEQQILTELFH